MIPANVSIGALLEETKRLRAELARRDEQLAAAWDEGWEAARTWDGSAIPTRDGWQNPYKRDGAS